MSPKTYTLLLALLVSQVAAVPISTYAGTVKRGNDADDAYHTITPHEKRGDDADDAYHTITPHDKRGDDADDAYHTITPHGH
ncbi:hypothetical protein VTN00DRAFT_2037 [Thermoascus crustaceus]|uniref:uncharacterized protein n=1 Tax=Thermoascus crustaceus TaxID=5088 RepID=UPI00374402FB